MLDPQTGLEKPDNENDTPEPELIQTEKKQEEEVEDFFEPLVFHWDPEKNRIRKLVKEYLAEFNADDSTSEEPTIENDLPVRVAVQKEKNEFGEDLLEPLAYHWDATENRVDKSLEQYLAQFDADN